MKNITHMHIDEAEWYVKRRKYLKLCRQWARREAALARQNADEATLSKPAWDALAARLEELESYATQAEAAEQDYTAAQLQVDVAEAVYEREHTRGLLRKLAACNCADCGAEVPAAAMEYVAARKNASELLARYEQVMGREYEEECEC